MALKEIAIAIGFPILRSVGGWLENSLKDGKIDSFEWAKLGETFVRVGVIAVTAYYGFTLAGVNMSIIATSAGAVVFDFLVTALKKKKK